MEIKVFVKWKKVKGNWQGRKKICAKEIRTSGLPSPHEVFYLQVPKEGANRMSLNQEYSKSSFADDDDGDDDFEEMNAEPYQIPSRPIFPGPNNGKIEKIKYKFLRPLINYIPFSILKQMGGGELVIPYFHVISDDEIEHVKYLYKYKSPKQFIDDLDFLLKNYKPTSLIEVIQNVREGVPLPHNYFLLTLDDGLREINDIISPILIAKGVPATIFLSSAFIDNKELCFEHKASVLGVRIRKGLSSAEDKEIRKLVRKENIFESNVTKSVLMVEYQQRNVLDRIGEILEINFEDYLQRNQPYLTSDQIKGLIKRGFTIGAHSIDHPIYTSLTLEEQLFQTIESVNSIRKKFDLGYGAFAFPHTGFGVSFEFFKIVQESGVVDISFGTGGMLKDSLPNHKERFSLEKPMLPAKEIIAWHYARTLFKKVMGENPRVR